MQPRVERFVRQGTLSLSALSGRVQEVLGRWQREGEPSLDLRDQLRSLRAFGPQQFAERPRPEHVHIAKAEWPRKRRPVGVGEANRLPDRHGVVIRRERGFNRFNLLCYASDERRLVRPPT